MAKGTKKATSKSKTKTATTKAKAKPATQPAKKPARTAKSKATAVRKVKTKPASTKPASTKPAKPITAKTSGKTPSAKAQSAKAQSAKSSAKAPFAKAQSAKSSAKAQSAKAQSAKAQSAKAPSTKAPSAKSSARTSAARPSLSLGKTLIDGAAARSYQLRAHIHGDLVSNQIDLYTGPTTISGNLALDFAGDGEDEPDGIIVDGDLVVTGAIVNRNSDTGPFLLVTGNVRAANLIAAGSEIVVLGDLIVEGVVFGFYNHGSVTVHGKSRARAIITEYHSFDLRGAVEAITVSGRGSITKADMFNSYAPALVAEVLTEGNPPGGYPDWKRTADAILEGRPVLRDDLSSAQSN